MLNSIQQVIEALEGATRLGAETDEPEGSRYIQISDTLAFEMVKALRRPGMIALDKETVDELAKNGIVYVDRMVIYTADHRDSLAEAKASSND
jgi:hypothetical protein